MEKGKKIEIKAPYRFEKIISDDITVNTVTTNTSISVPLVSGWTGTLQGGTVFSAVLRPTSGTISGGTATLASVIAGAGTFSGGTVNVTSVIAGAGTFTGGAVNAGTIIAGAGTFTGGQFYGDLRMGGAAPGSAAATGTAGQHRYDGTYFYVCSATNTWIRGSFATW